MCFFIAGLMSRNPPGTAFKGERQSQVHEDYSYKMSPQRNQDYLTKVQQLIK